LGIGSSYDEKKVSAADGAFLPGKLSQLIAVFIIVY